MREYEIMVITKPDLPESDLAKTVDRWENIMKTGGGEILKKDNWGAKRLAYQIQKFTRGVYHVYNVATPGENVKELDRVMRIDEGVLRNMSLQVSENCAVEDRKAELSKQDFGPKHREFERSPRAGGGRFGGPGRSDRGDDFDDRSFSDRKERGRGDRAGGEGLDLDDSDES
jgi:small subunit ribosomal protein S6